MEQRGLENPNVPASPETVLLFINGMFWKSIPRDELIIARLDTPPVRSDDPRQLLPLSVCYPTRQGGDVLLPITHNDKRTLEHWFPGIGIRLISISVAATDPLPFNLGVATGTPDNPEFIERFDYCLVDTASKEWASFSQQIAAFEDITPMWLPFSFLDYWHTHTENCCD